MAKTDTVGRSFAGDRGGSTTGRTATNERPHERPPRRVDGLDLLALVGFFMSLVGAFAWGGWPAAVWWLGALLFTFSLAVSALNRQ